MQMVKDIQFFMPKNSEPGIKDVVENGKKSGCPFCKYRFRDLPKVGERIRFWSDFQIGQIGTVVPIPKNLQLRQNEIVVSIDNEYYDCTVSLDRDLIGALPDAPIPEWLPPMPLREAEELDRAVIWFCSTSSWKPRPKPDWQAFRSLTQFIWQKRFPIELHELMAILIAHGVPNKSSDDLARYFNYGRELLISVAGRKPIKKKRRRTWTYRGDRDFFSDYGKTE